ncbi:hypothetical protein GWK48_10925 [Metallosphaera tengchongensis]|uniref:Thermopsin family protease n=1 Tax=Metallosphaera tengchongensis TaxID=1532350 RepID=A0A6N0NX70_9CREN|nr:hypothetical protein [Metallosphaera tengchongensis]QKR00827.1 hypothetical protein GWK48_10925 [Metallosphaera tengchongensis]
MRSLLPLLLLFLLLPLPSSSFSPTNYGYEFGYVPMGGIQTVVVLYNISLALGSPDMSVQQNVCLNVGGQEVFVQNVLEPLSLTESGWQTSVYFNGAYNETNSNLQGHVFNLTTTWYQQGNFTVIKFYLSNGTFKGERTYLLPGKLLDVVFSGYTTGTVVGGFGNGITAYLGEGFNVSMESFYLFNGTWYVPPIAWSGWVNTGEKAVGGSAYYYDGKVWVVFGNSTSPQLLYNVSVVVVGNQVYTFPKDSLWEAGGKYFVNSTDYVEGEVLRPVGTNYSFTLEKKYQVECSCVMDGVKGNAFYLPSPETVYVREGDRCVALYVNSSRALGNSTGVGNTTNSGVGGAVPHSGTTSPIDVSVWIWSALVVAAVIAVYFLMRKR